MDISGNVAKFNSGFDADARDASFDYCFNYFQAFAEQCRTEELSSELFLEQSCLHLGFFLASWGMYRGSAKLFQHSSRFLVPIIQAIAQADAEIWKIDVSNYDEGAISRLIEMSTAIRRGRDWMSDILVTKIMLGVFGSVPAFDTVFSSGCRRLQLYPWFSERALKDLAQFHGAHAELVEKARQHTLDFLTGQLTSRRYTCAKVLDMVIFVEGSLLSQTIS